MRNTAPLITGAILLGLALAPTNGASAATPSSGVTRHALTAKPTDVMTLSIGQGQLVQLPAAMSDLFVADPAVADVQARSRSQLYVFGKGGGSTVVYATDATGKVVWSSTVRVDKNITNVETMLKLAMPDADIKATTMNGIVLLTGTVAAPADVEEAQKLVEKFVGAGKDGDGVQVVNRIKSATPLQVQLRVKIAEVNRAFAKSVGVNLLSQDTSGGFLFGVGRGDAGTITTTTDPVTGLPNGTEYKFNNAVGATTLGFAKHMLGMDLLATLDLAETDGQLTTLAEPNLTAMSGETASFLAGGEIPIPLSQGLGAVSVEFKQYGVSLSFTPTVLSGGRISLRVRPEVSQLSSAGAVKVGSIEIPGITTRRMETTVELGSGQAFVIGGLLSNTSNNTIDKAPFLGDLPILGNLFRSTGFKRNETELMVVVTPYLVRPVSASQIALPTDGMRAPTDGEAIIAGQIFSGKPGAKPAVPQAAPARTIPAPQGPVSKAAPKSTTQTASIPDAGFSIY
ncbi:type II and III secretion system protein family protein [Sphingomonas crocodyli]|uniref:Type II and III secretion system protein family protein n=1 Tax=Sphingomonas crocodyli TaxID=1979270 RepID=A0A437M6T2_9SPHN|nr:type II and III secretion system protein family protein [Sphingomonas crocodyli]RVT93347.1 type II and III secretion system protein family protein [Sphingomonas crocodyli]